MIAFANCKTSYQSKTYPAKNSFGLIRRQMLISIFVFLGDPFMMKQLFFAAPVAIHASLMAAMSLQGLLKLFLRPKISYNANFRQGPEVSVINGCSAYCSNEVRSNFE